MEAANIARDDLASKECVKCKACGWKLGDKSAPRDNSKLSKSQTRSLAAEENQNLDRGSFVLEVLLPEMT